MATTGIVSFLHRRLRWRNLILLVLVVPWFVIPIQSASPATWIWRMTRPSGRFVAYVGDPRVRYEPGAEVLAKVVADSLPEAIRTVERKFGRPFLGPMTVYVCATEKTFEDFTGQRGSGGVLNKRIFISSKQAGHLERIPSLVAHELAHHHIYERRGFLTRHYRAVMTESQLMREGLAVYGSEGGGADRVSIREAWLALAAGKHMFAPQFGGVGSDMLYRQGGMFVEFLAGRDAEKFKQFLVAVESGRSADKSLPVFFGETLEQLWGRFLVEAERESKM